MPENRSHRRQPDLGKQRLVPNSCSLIVMRYSENDVVDRGYRAILMIHQLTNRVPSLIEQSHLERNEGISPLS